MSTRAATLILFLLVLPFFLTWTFDHSLWNPDETRDAGIAWEMFQEGNYVVPKLNGEAFLEKPPLYYWSCSLVYFLFGKVTAGLTRLPAALYGFLGILFTFLLGKRLFNNQVGVMAALLLSTAANYFRTSHFAVMDSCLTALLTGALYFYVIRKYGLFIIFVILAFYAKGFVAVALAGLVVGVDLSIQRQPKRLLLVSLLGATLFLLLVSPWVYGLWKEGGSESLKVFFIDNNWARFVSREADHQGPFYFYVGSFLVDFLPWSFLFIGSLCRAFAERKNLVNRGSHRFLWVWFAAIFFFLSLSKSKRSIYLLPALPAAALLSARWLDQVFAHASHRRTDKIVIGSTVVLSFLIGLVVLGGHVFLHRAFVVPMIGFIFIGGGILLTLRQFSGRNYSALMRTSFATVALSIVLANRFFIKDLDAHKTFVPFCDAIKRHAPNAEILSNHLNEMERGVFSFYLKRRIKDFVRQNQIFDYMKKHPDRKILLITQKNKVLPLELQENLNVIFRYRPNEKRRSYLLYSNHFREGQDERSS